MESTPSQNRALDAGGILHNAFKGRQLVELRKLLFMDHLLLERLYDEYQEYGIAPVLLDKDAPDSIRVSEKTSSRQFGE
jgi:hypothetical protein